MKAARAEAGPPPALRRSKPGGRGQGTTVQEALSVLRIAKASQEPIVADMAAEIATRFGVAP